MKNFTISITANEIKNSVFEFSSERLNLEGTTYLSIGKIPCSKYSISFSDNKKELSKYWPSTINGIDISGTLFDKKTGKRLPYDSDVIISKDYYFLCKCPYIRFPSAVSSKEISAMTISYNTLYLYEIRISELNEDVAKFFLKYHYRLTASPVSIHPVWPPYIKGTQIIKYFSDSITMIVRGNIYAFKTFPYISIQHTLKSESFELYEINASNRQQLISIGRSNVLKYTYLWRERICLPKDNPNFTITDIDGTPAICGSVSSIPKSGLLKVLSEYDGEIVISKKDIIINRYKILSDKLTEIKEIAYGQTVTLNIGLDCVWEANYKKADTTAMSNNERYILSYITNNAGSAIIVPHSIKNMLSAFKDYPQIHSWISKCIKKGVIPEKSFRRIQKIYINSKQT